MHRESLSQFHTPAHALQLKELGVALSSMGAQSLAVHPLEHTSRSPPDHDNAHQTFYNKPDSAHKSEPTCRNVSLILNTCYKAYPENACTQGRTRDSGSSLHPLVRESQPCCCCSEPTGEREKQQSNRQVRVNCLEEDVLREECTSTYKVLIRLPAMCRSAFFPRGLPSPSDQQRNTLGCCAAPHICPVP